ncbi:MAG: nitroreductase family protein [Thermodesulfobacteriota bacterium]
MSDLMEIIKGRRSIRKYEDRPVPAEHLNKILEAVQWSPSWANTQVWEIVVIEDRGLKERLRDTISKGNPSTKAVAEAPLLLAVCAKLKSSGYYNNAVTTKFGDWFMFDLGLAVQNLCLMAHDLGLGTVVVGLFDHDLAKPVLKVPEGYELVALIPLGYPAKSPAGPKRREIGEFTHRETF